VRLGADGNGIVNVVAGRAGTSRLGAPGKACRTWPATPNDRRDGAVHTGAAGLCCRG
jgi:hypothetical protein